MISAVFFVFTTGFDAQTAMATPQQPAIDIGDLVSAMDAYGLQAGIVDDIVDTVEAKPDMTLTQLVELLRAKKVSTANAHRIKAKLEAASKASMVGLCLSLSLVVIHCHGHPFLCRLW